MNSIFLSASIPNKYRNPKYWESSDLIAIRDSIISLVNICLYNKIRIIWGGHPAITPLVYQAVKLFTSDNSSCDFYELKKSIQEYVHIYQSKFFENKFPPDNNQFENIILIDSKPKDRDGSLAIMRDAMIKSTEFLAGVFIGGMEGVEEEYKIFIETHPNAIRLPIASTGAAALLLYEKDINDYEQDLKTNYAYNSLFSKYLLKYDNR